MKFWIRLAGFSLAVVVIGAAGLASAQEQAAGVVRISDQAAAGEQMKLQAYHIASKLGGGDCDTHSPDCDSETVYCDDDGCRYCDGHGHGCCWRHKTWELICHPFCADDCYEGPRVRTCPPENCPYCRNGNCPYHGHRFGDGFGDGFGRGYHAKRGVAPFGCYTIAYPLNPEYCDDRGGKLYAAQGYGINVTVPLAPNVGAAYNYGWGVPSSRLTRISNPLPVPPISSLPGPTPIVIRNR